MAFVSLPFAVFVTVVVAAYFLCPMKYRWMVLLIASYAYFWINSEWLLLIMMASTVATYATARVIFAMNGRAKQYLTDHSAEMNAQERKAYKNSTKKKTKYVLLLGICIDLGILLVLKYFNFFADISNSVLRHVGIVIPRARFLLPIGISFYTLQAIAYMTDIYRNKYEPDRNLGKFMLYMSYFPQIVQGPIARHPHLANQLYEGHAFDFERMKFGLQLILWGFFKKLMIADRIAIPVNEIFDNYSAYRGWMYFLGAVFYGIQVYTDFSGGMDIARGISQILGIELELNFKQPYFARSIEEFWRRWHITLGAWMREYVFYPLSLSKSFGKLGKASRKVFGTFVGKRLPAFLAMFIVYFLVGLWHGAEMKYMAYGVWNGVFIVAGILLAEVYDRLRTRYGIDSESAAWKAFQMARTFALVSVGRLFSRADNMMIAMQMMGSMVTKCYDLSAIKSIYRLGLGPSNWLILLAAIAVLFAVDYLHERNVRIREKISEMPTVLRWGLYYAAIIALLVFGVYGPSYDAKSFIYEQF